MTAEKPRGRPFRPGQSGNPRGKATGSRPKAMVALDALAEGHVSDIVAAMAERASSGDVQAATLILARVWPPRRGRPTPLSLPRVETPADLTAATGAVIQAMAHGTLTAEEAHAVAAVLTVHRQALETADLEARISALEAARGDAP